MRHVYRLAMVLAIGFGRFSSPVSAQQPTTQPSAPAARILILPFAVNATGASGGLGRSMQQSILADLTPAAPGRLISADTNANDTSAAVAAGRAVQADYVVIGSLTALELPTGKSLRIVGQVVDVAHQTALSGFKTTGMYADIFQLEDQVGRQVRRRLSDAGAIQIPMIAVGPSAVPDVQPVEVAQAPVVNEYEQAYGNPHPMIGGAADSSYNYYYGNPSIAGGYDQIGGFGFPLFIYGNGGYHGYGSQGFGRGGFHDHGFGSGGNATHSGGSHRSGQGRR